MPDRRRIVPDNSVIVSAMLKKDQYTNRARQCVNSIMNGTVVCFAPDVLLVEFLKIAFDFRSGRRQDKGAVEDIDGQIETFLGLEIEYDKSIDLATATLDHMKHHEIPMPDAYYLAAAEAHSAELWVSHLQKDRFSKNAKNFYEKVFTLADNDFYSVGKRFRG